MASSASLALMGVLAGCTVGPEYVRPKIDSPESFSTPTRSDTINAAPRTGLTSDAPAPGSLDRWWKALNDPSLDVLIERALEENHDLRLASQRVMEAAALRGVEVSRLLPTIDANAGATRTRDSANLVNFAGAGLERSRFGAGIDAAWEIDVFGRVRRSIEAADADLQGQIEAGRAIRVMVAAEVALAYVEARTYEARIRVAQGAIKAQADTLALTESRFRAGLTSEVDVMQAKAQLLRREGLLPTLRVGLHGARHRLGVLTGRAPGSDLGFPEEGEIPVVSAPMPMGAPSELLDRRPDLRQAERELAAATARIGVATADLYPRFTLLGTAGLASQQAGDLFEASSRLWSIGPSVQWNVFDASQRRHTIKAADERAAQAMTRYEQSMLLALEDVENAATSFVQLQARERALAGAVEADRRAVDLTTDRYRSGVGDFLSVLDAQRQLYDTSDLRADAAGSVSRAYVRLAKALGGGWGFSSQAEPQEQHLPTVAP